MNYIRSFMVERDARRLSRPTYAEVDLDAISYNISAIRERVRPSRVMAVVKADGYGHGAVDVAKTALSSGAEWLGVALVSEAEELRLAGIEAPVLLLGSTPDYYAARVVLADAAQAVFTEKLARALSDAARAAGTAARVHVKVDTGMGRVGVWWERAAEFVARIASMPCVEVEGIFTHFAAADEVGKAYAEAQFNRFQMVISELDHRGLRPPICHAGNSACVLDLAPETYLDMVRAGIMIYGLYPSADVRHTIELRPAMSLRTEVAYIKRVPPGFFVSYGCTYCTFRETTLATLPLGYADGVSRLLSNNHEVLIRGERHPLVGRVTMDQVVVDVGDAPVEEGDEAVLFGRQGKGFVSVDEMARRIGTINYEVTCMVSPRVPRVYLQGGRWVVERGPMGERPL